MKGKVFDAEFYHESKEILRIGNHAVRLAQQESRELGVPNVYCFNGHIYYELQNGDLTLNDPYTE